MIRLGAIVAVMAVVVMFAPLAEAAEGLPWQTDKEEPAADGPEQKGESAENPEGEGDQTQQDAAVDLKEALPPEMFQRAIQPILTQIEQAERVTELYEKEMAKEERLRSEKRALDYRLSAAKCYTAAMHKARQATQLIKDADLQAAVKDQYELPLLNKAVGIYLTLANEARARGDLRNTVAYYQQTLKLDPENAVAKEELKKLAELVQERAAERNRSRRPTTGSSGKDNKDEEEREEDDEED